MLRRLTQWTLLVLSTLLCATPAAAQGPTVEARFDAEQEELLLTIRAENASFRELLGVVAFEIGATRGTSIQITGLEKLARNPRVDVFVVDRPWRDALRWIAGSADLSVVVRSTEITVNEALPDFPTAEELRMRALLSYRQIQNDSATSGIMPDVLVESGRLALKLGPDFAQQAQGYFEGVLENHPTSDRLWEAMYLSAEVYASMKEWGKAALRFHEVADSIAMHEYHVDARRSMAIALCELGESQSEQPLAAEESGEKAVITLQALDRYYPTDDRAEQRSRALIMGRALALAGKPVEALRALDVAAARSALAENDPEVLTVRAKALSRSGRFGDASTAWLAVSKHSTGKQLENALIEAAQEALKGGHELAVLAIHKQAVRNGFGRRLDPMQREAKLRLGIDDEIDGLSLSQQLVRALHLSRRGLYAEAVRAMRGIYLRRGELNDSDRIELALAYARALNKEDLPREAIEALRVMAGESNSAMDRRRIYTLAAQIHEIRGNYEAAIEALQGKL